MLKNMNWLMKLVLITAFAGFVFFVFLPILQSFFDPQEFISFLNPLAMKMPVGQYMVESWSWVNTQGVLIGFFRPLISASFMVEYPLFGSNPLGYKLVNLSMHLLCGFCIARFVNILSGNKKLSLFAGALFILHPGTVVATGMIVSRHDILVCLFSVLAISSTYTLSRTSAATWKAVVPAVFMFLAVNSKELGMMNLITLPIMFFFWPGRVKNRKNTIVFISSLIFVELLYLVARKLVFGNIGGYGSYTEFAAVPSHIITLITQSTGLFFIDLKFFKIAFFLFLIYIVINYARGRWHNWQKVLVVILVTGAYSSQSIIGDVATHYVYAATAFTVLFLVYFSERFAIPGRYGKHIKTGIAIMILISAGTLTRSEGLAFNHIYVDCERVFNSLEEISDLLPNESGSVCFVVVSRNSAIQAEMKNVPLYMNSIDKNSQCEYVLIGNYEEATGSPILIWEADGIVIR